MKLRVWFIKPHVNFYVNIESEEYEYFSKYFDERPYSKSIMFWF